jgi:hypothetical protein
MSPSVRSNRWLYLLAMFQLVAGPLVLTQVVVFCKLTLKSLPEQTLTEAVVDAWESAEFGEAVAAAQASGDKGLPAPGKKTSQPDIKQVGVLWSAALRVFPPSPALHAYAAWRSDWTPREPDDPPGHPPCVA